MTAFRMLLVVLIIVMAGAFTWLSFQWSQTANSEEPYGVAFELVDSDGAEVTQAAFQGKPTALFFGFTHCPDVCPTTLFELDAWMDQADPSGEKLHAYMVTVDPERDSHEILGRYISNVSDRIKGITGDPEKVRAMAKGFNVYFKKVPNEEDDDYVMDHTASVFLLGEGGRFKGTIAYGENSETAIKKLKNLL